MSTQMTRRRLLTTRGLCGGLGIVTLALLTRTQHASADTPFTTFSFPATGAPTPRTMPNRLAEVVNVKDFGAAGDGSMDDTAAIQAALNAAYGSSSSPNGSFPGSMKNRAVFFPAGYYKITRALTLKSVMGAHIFGAGRFATTIQNVTSGGSVFVTNGCQYSRFEQLNLMASGTNSVCFDLDFDGNGIPLQSNTFSDIYFQGADTGLRIGNSGFMGSENLITNCFFANHRLYGLVTMNFNALQQTVIGGNFQNCGIGIKVERGSVPVIHGVGFQQSARLDILVSNGANDAISIKGCRTESLNFADINHQAAVIEASTQTNADPGIFAVLRNPGIISGCISINGQCDIQVGGAVDCSQFGRNDWIVARSTPVYTRVLRTGRTWVMSGVGIPRNYGIGSWTSAVYTGS
jgi:Pectate lyase superfamily protein